jgi:hypothetical protein
MNAAEVKAIHALRIHIHNRAGQEYKAGCYHLCEQYLDLVDDLEVVLQPYSSVWTNSDLLHSFGWSDK